MPEVYGDREKLQQVIVNLLINARQAVDAGGRVRVRTACRPDRRAVTLEVHDSGHGIAPEHLNRIFDPFFTTKPVGRGTGLGLSLSYGIVQEHGGSIHVTSRIDEGSVFTVELPPAADPPPAEEGRR